MENATTVRRGGCVPDGAKVPVWDGPVGRLPAKRMTTTVA